MHLDGQAAPPKSVLLCVATEKGCAVLDTALADTAHTRLLVCTFQETRVATSYTDRILARARAHDLPVVRWSEFRRDPLGFLSRESIDAILCIGWRYLIPRDVIATLDGNVVAAHDSLLPRLRGFAPLPTALIAGEPQVGVTYLRVGPGMDDGDILWQQAVDVLPRDTIADLIHRTIPLYCAGAKRFLRGELRDGTPQDEAQATYSIWRDEIDYWIDWSQDAARIDRTIRALGEPYLGAHCHVADQTVIIHEACVAPDVRFAIRQPGKAWALDEAGRPTVVCGSGMLRVLSASCAGEPLLPLRSLRVRFH